MATSGKARLGIDLDTQPFRGARLCAVRPRLATVAHPDVDLFARVQFHTLDGPAPVDASHVIVDSLRVLGCGLSGSPRESGLEMLAGLSPRESPCTDPVLHQIVEIPPVAAEVIEYVLHRIRCRRCGEVTAADLPEVVPTGCAGVRFQAIMTLLTGRCRLSRREAREIAISLFGPKARVWPST